VGLWEPPMVPVAFRLVPYAIGVQPRSRVFGELITGEQWHVSIGDLLGHPIEPQVGTLLSALPNDKSQHQPPDRRTGNSHPGIVVRLVGDLGGGPVALLGVYETPELIQLALRDMQIAPQIHHHPTTVVGGRLSQSQAVSVSISTLRAGARSEFPSAKARTAVSKIAGGAPKLE